MLGGLVAVLAGHLIETVKLRAYATALYAVALASLACALVFGLVALRHWIVLTYHAQYPDLWIALLMAIVALIFGGVGYALQRRKPPTNPAADIAFLAAPPAARLALRNINGRALAVGAVLLAGLLVGRRLTHRAPPSP